MGDMQRAFIREVAIRAEGCCHQTLPLNIAPIAAVARSRPTAGLAPWQSLLFAERGAKLRIVGAGETGRPSLDAESFVQFVRKMAVN